MTWWCLLLFSIVCYFENRCYFLASFSILNLLNTFFQFFVVKKFSCHEGPRCTMQRISIIIFGIGCDFRPGSCINFKCMAPASIISTKDYAFPKWAGSGPEYSAENVMGRVWTNLGLAPRSKNSPRDGTKCNLYSIIINMRASKFNYRSKCNYFN